MHRALACRAAYPKVQHKAAELTSALSKLSSGGEAVDMAYALMCESMDMLGLAGFQKEYHNVKHLSKGEPAEVLDVCSALPIITATLWPRIEESELHALYCLQRSPNHKYLDVHPCVLRGGILHMCACCIQPSLSYQEAW